MNSKFKAVLAGILLMLFSVSAYAQLSGAIFTTLEDGARVNANIYEAKEDVYLDGGPPGNAPIDSAGLPAGTYYFQVTDPSGKVLLSEDPVKCRQFVVNDDGVIAGVVPAVASMKVRGKITDYDCTHLTGVDVDHNAVTVQLMPYENTPNRGGVYKVWATPIEMFDGDPELVDNPGHFHGFIPRWSKTDNYKVRKGKDIDPPMISVLKFNDVNWNGMIDDGEAEIGVDELLSDAGWPVWATDPLGVTNNAFTPWYVDPAMPIGTWIVAEDAVDNWTQTGLMVDGVYVTPAMSTQVEILGNDGETHEVVFLNAEYGDVKICKSYVASGGKPVTGFKVCLEGTDLLGNDYPKMCKLTGVDGCVMFDDLVPGSYVASEVVPSNWTPVGDITQNIDVSGGNVYDVEFVNYCSYRVEMFTKGFWQNKGCDIVTDDDLDFLNLLAPYAAADIMTNGLDNCSGNACPDVTQLPFDTPGELGCYIVAPNSNENNIGLGQQLAAFILNMQYADVVDGTAVLPDGPMAVTEIIEAAVLSWQTGIGVSYWQNLLDELNNLHEVGLEIIPNDPCPVVYD